MRLEGLVIPVNFDEGGFDGSLSSIKRKLTDFGADAAALGIAAGVGSAIVGFIGSTIQPAADAETALSRLAIALEASGRNAEISTPQLAGIATSLSDMSAFGDEDIIQAFQIMTQFSQVPTSAFEAVAQMGMDLAAFEPGEQSVSSEVEAIGRALETGIIPRTWAFTEAQKEQFKALYESGQNAETLAFMMDTLNKKYGGQAAAELGTYNGQVKDLGDKWGEFKESIGAEIIPSLSGLLGWVNLNFDGIVRWIDGITDVLFLWKGLAGVSQDIAAGFEGFTPSGSLVDWFNGLGGGGSGGNNGQAVAAGGSSQPFDYHLLASILAAEVAKVNQ